MREQGVSIENLRYPGRMATLKYEEPDPCEVHLTHTPHMALGDEHHVWPKGLGGPDIPSNIVTVCPTGHRNIHQLLEEFALYKGVPPWDVLKRWGVEERKLAALGWKRMTNKKM
jgi:hypothetical protein